ncbi:MAG: hypothetical protein ACOY3I_06480 [Verrucomicrobiota bacterium]
MQVIGILKDFDPRFSRDELPTSINRGNAHITIDNVKVEAIHPQAIKVYKDSRPRDPHAHERITSDKNHTIKSNEPDILDEQDFKGHSVTWLENGDAEEKTHVTRILWEYSKQRVELTLDEANIWPGRDFLIERSMPCQKHDVNNFFPPKNVNNSVSVHASPETVKKIFQEYGCDPSTTGVCIFPPHSAHLARARYSDKIIMEFLRKVP